MQKEKVLVFDSKGIFLRMFKRRFKEEFDFVENSFFDKTVTTESDRIVFVIHNHNELLNFLSQEKRGSNVLVCLFNLQFYRSLSFLEGTNNFILFDESKTRTEILKELKAFFDNKLDSNTIKKSLLPPNVSYRKFQEYYKAMYFLM
ncbi:MULTISPECIES: hypothetical protein [Flavobacterium]|uniref:Uncharacterized protein n=1 Tax=Flavobacterium anhuiense TaxID=459526 RepID=A0ABY0M237_9FLAO|nr:MULTISPECIES: hypothetical protein [Flavobacterium]EJG00205.1 hypothetical protein FF52_17543 [Flavobacterium sp. F52]MXO04647.1 hypothetical protein [Flavobacterium sp. HBTb2-11-1]URM36335.1 hypothetical protein LLY39_18240 [Flavobacterium anhuiense]SCY92834.1 hypothetical protein SAMN02927916_4150 [Flavobacterium anhuiense]